MRRAILIIVACVLVMRPVSAMTQSGELVFTGAKLLEACTKQDQEWISFCNGYLQAAFDALGGRDICTPKNVTRNDFYDTAIPVLMQSPKLKAMNAVPVLWALWWQAYPCN